ncbi:MAG TPA: VIT domain-containing protein [Steroidobacteraceae bacterium]|nr:VIT domain-containing protein [Steroidobacteraceae bacterium]
MDAAADEGRHAPEHGLWRPRAFIAALFLLGGVLLPIATIGFELVTRMCAETLFDPLPSWAHLAVVTAVPVLNLRLWLMRRSTAGLTRGWIFASGAATAVGFCYTLLFLPVYPIAVIGILFFGLGLLPFAPLSAGLVALAQAVGAGRARGQPYARPLWAGFAAGFVLIMALDTPTAITRYAVRASASADAADRARAVRLMRHAGNRDLLLRLCYDRSGYTGGLLGLIVEGTFSLSLDDFDRRRLANPTESARELFYRVTGDAYDSVPPPYRGGRWSFAGGFDWDRDQGGAQVGGRLAGLSLASSRIDASMDADDAVAYLEWTAEFANAEQWQQREARLALALPPGGVVSRATLWVNGEEREAAFASRGAVRAAYERVVTGRRDPLLVTSDGADQVLVQMFPVPAGGRAKIRIGITAPLALSADDRATLALPAIVDRNFSIDEALRHAVWIEGEGRDAPSDAGFTAATADGAVIRRRASFTDAELSGHRPRIALTRNPRAETVASGDVVQTIRREPREPAGSLFVLLDGSARARPARVGLLAALDRIPTGQRVGFAVAAEGDPALPLAAWDSARRAELTKLLDAQAFDGGEDNVGALAAVLGALEGEPRATLLWVHGPQGFEFAGNLASLEQVLDRGTRLPDLWLLPVAPGPNRALGRASGGERRLFTGARLLAWSGDPAADIRAAFDDYFDTAPRWTISRGVGSTAGLVTGSAHVEKLWAFDEIQAQLAATPRKPAEAQAVRERAIALAARYRIVTPVSGAVVLETDADYTQAGLTPPDPSAVPTIPEPETWALLIVACLAFAWAWRARLVPA